MTYSLPRITYRPSADPRFEEVMTLLALGWVVVFTAGVVGSTSASSTPWSVRPWRTDQREPLKKSVRMLQSCYRKGLDF